MAEKDISKIEKSQDSWYKLQEDEKWKKWREKYKTLPYKRFQLACYILNNNLENNATANKNNEKFSYDYCSLNNVLENINNIFPKLNLSVIQTFDYSKETNKNLIITKVLDLNTKAQSTVDINNECNNNKYVLHKSIIAIPDIDVNQYIKLPKDDGKAIYKKNINQLTGESITYFRRYSLYTILNCFPENDNDGETPEKKPKWDINNMDILKEKIKNTEYVLKNNKVKDEKQKAGMEKWLLWAKKEYFNLVKQKGGE